MRWESLAEIPQKLKGSRNWRSNVDSRISCREWSDASGASCCSETSGNHQQVTPKHGWLSIGGRVIILRRGGVQTERSFIVCFHRPWDFLPGMVLFIFCGNLHNLYMRRHHVLPDMIEYNPKHLYRANRSPPETKVSGETVSCRIWTSMARQGISSSCNSRWD